METTTGEIVGKMVGTELRRAKRVVAQGRFAILRSVVYVESAWLCNPIEIEVNERLTSKVMHSKPLNLHT